MLNKIEERLSAISQGNILYLDCHGEPHAIFEENTHVVGQSANIVHICTRATVCHGNILFIVPNKDQTNKFRDSGTILQ